MCVVCNQPNQHSATTLSFKQCSSSNYSNNNDDNVETFFIVRPSIQKPVYHHYWFINDDVWTKFQQKKETPDVFRIRQKKGCARGYNFLFCFFEWKKFPFPQWKWILGCGFSSKQAEKNGLIIISIINIIEFLIDNFLSFFEKKFKEKFFLGFFCKLFLFFFVFILPSAGKSHSNKKNEEKKMNLSKCHFKQQHLRTKVEWKMDFLNNFFLL